MANSTRDERRKIKVPHLQKIREAMAVDLPQGGNRFAIRAGPGTHSDCRDVSII